MIRRSEDSIIFCGALIRTQKSTPNNDILVCNTLVRCPGNRFAYRIQIAVLYRYNQTPSITPAPSTERLDEYELRDTVGSRGVR